MPASHPLRKAYHWYRSLRLPWRRKYLIGHDLSANLYWELAPSYALSARPRRLVSRAARAQELLIPPQWHQWLRHVRSEPPSVEELLADVERVQVLKGRVAEVERRWGGAGLVRGERGQGVKRGAPGEEWGPSNWVPGKAEGGG
ncbi:MAG: hypothetical protein M1829_005583 [Trizodia sp. TS-e1964]|nr:MAG: hypothetical protein M1829_005583 [Trizodia sp. TS-e1964]